MNDMQLLREWIRATAEPWDDVESGISRPQTPQQTPQETPPESPHLRAVAADATVVAVGSSTRAAHEPAVAAHRILRFLVEEMGFRAVLLEGDDAKAAELAEYLRTGRGEPSEILADARSFWRTEETLDVVTWLRSYNKAHPDDPVRLVEADDPHGASGQGDLSTIEQHLATTVVRWHERTGDAIVYWGGIAHTAVGSQRVVTQHTDRETQRNAGSRLRERFGDAYRSIGITFHHGTLHRGAVSFEGSASFEGAGAFEVPAPPVDYAEHALSTAGLPPYLIDLRAAAPEPVRRWLDAPTRTRLIGPHYDPDNDAAYHLSGQSPAEWFDAVVHIPTVTPQRRFAE